jgi:arylsulfatase A-like enzyme
VPFGGVADGLTQWEVTIAESLSAAGYATALYGKWHLGSNDGRLPNDQGFDEWYGIPRTTDEALWPSSPGYSTAIMPPEQILEGKKGEKSRAVRVYDVEQRRLIDAEITRRTVAFMERQASAKKPFFAYATLTQPHLPTLPNPAFAGKTGNGDWADMLAEMDANVGQMLDSLGRLGGTVAGAVLHGVGGRHPRAVHDPLAGKDPRGPRQRRDRPRGGPLPDPRQRGWSRRSEGPADRRLRPVQLLPGLDREVGP